MKIDIVHQERNEECFEILKSTIVEDKDLKRYKIDKHTLLHELPESVVNEFLDFLGTEEQHRNLMLYMIKNGTLVINCWEEVVENKDHLKMGADNVKEKQLINKKRKTFKPFDPHDSAIDDSLPF